MCVLFLPNLDFSGDFYIYYVVYSKVADCSLCIKDFLKLFATYDLMTIPPNN